MCVSTISGGRAEWDVFSGLGVFVSAEVENSEAPRTNRATKKERAENVFVVGRDFKVTS
jgi:hypothetical protein